MIALKTKNHYRVLLLLSLSPAAFAQYAPTISDLNQVFNPPMNINNIICDSVRNDGHAYGICSDGVSAARFMAEKYAQNSGRYLGCLDGLYQGIQVGYSTSSSPTATILQEAQNYIKGASFQSAISRAESKARTEARTESADQIISRYRAVIDRPGVAINKNYEFPVINFLGFEDGYETDVLATRRSEFEPVYNAGWEVSAQSALEDQIAARHLYDYQRTSSGELCSIEQTIFGRKDMPIISIWDIFRNRRREIFQQIGWRDPNWAWEVFEKFESTLEQYKSYRDIETLTKTETVVIELKAQRIKLDANNQPIPVRDSQGNPVLDSSGRPTYQMEEYITGHRTEQRVVKLSESEKNALRAQYVRGFKEAYDRYYARQYASLSYHKSGLEKYQLGVSLGQNVGKEVATNIAKRKAYNEVYKAQSASRFAEVSKQIYKDSFDNLLKIFENNPVMELNEAVVLGQVDDSIFRPGEELRLQFAVTNLGEKSRPTVINFDNTQHILASVKGHTFEAPALRRFSAVTGTLGMISRDLFAQNTINVSMGFNNPGDIGVIARNIVAKKNQSLLINDLVEIQSVLGSIDPLTGQVNFELGLVNPSSVRSPVSDVKVELTGLGTETKAVMELSAQSTRKIAVNFSMLDPLTLINQGKVSGAASVILGDRVVHRVNVESSSTANRNELLVEYFTGLAVNKYSLTGLEKKSDRIVRLMEIFVAMIRDSIVKENINWEREVGKTVLVLIQKSYRDAKSLGQITQESQNLFNELGRRLGELQRMREFRGGGGIRTPRGNKKDFAAQVQVFAPNVKHIP